MRPLLALALAAALLAAAPARAEPPSGDAVAAAREAFTEAERAFERGEHERALVLFRLAYDRAPRDAVRFNIAVCLEQLQRWSEARTEYEAAAASPALSDAERADARKHASALQQVTAELLIEGAPGGARLRVDSTPRCTLPCRVFVSPGAHRVEVQRGSDVAAREVQAAAAQTVKVPITFAPPAPTAAANTPAASGRAGWLTITGGVVAALGTGGLIGFGLRASTLHDEYTAAPTAAAREEGLLMKGLANASIGVLSLGALLVVGDLLLFKTGARRNVTASPAGLAFTF